MIHRQQVGGGLALAVLAVLAMAWTGTTRAAAIGAQDPQYASPSPYASPSGGDVVDKTRSGAEKVGEKVKEGAEKTGEAVGHAAHEVKHEAKPVAKEVGHATKEGAHKTGEVLDATKQHVDVKAALLADKTVDASHIDIDIDKDTKTLHLRGTVPTPEQRDKAGRIARDKAGDYTISNELTVMAVPRK